MVDVGSPVGPAGPRKVGTEHPLHRTLASTPPRRQHQLSMPPRPAGPTGPLRPPPLPQENRPMGEASTRTSPPKGLRVAMGWRSNQPAPASAVHTPWCARADPPGSGPALPTKIATRGGEIRAKWSWPSPPRSRRSGPAAGWGEIAIRRGKPNPSAAIRCGLSNEKPGPSIGGVLIGMADVAAIGATQPEKRTDPGPGRFRAAINWRMPFGGAHTPHRLAKAALCPPREPA